MFERKKEICKWLNKDDYILAAGYSELDANLIDGDSYKTILKKVIEHRKEIMALPNQENPEPDYPFESEPCEATVENFLTLPICNTRSKKRQLYDSYCAIYRLTAIIDYYDSILSQNTKINEYVKKYENDYELIKRVNEIYRTATQKNKFHPSSFNIFFQDQIVKYINEKEHNSFYFQVFGEGLISDDFQMIKDEDDIEAILCEKLLLKRDQFLAFKYYDDTKLPELKAEDRKVYEPFISPRIIIEKLTAQLRNEEKIIIKKYTEKAEKSNITFE